GENSRWRGGPAGPQHAVSNEPRQSAPVLTFIAARDRLETSDRAAPINDQDRFTALETVDQGTQGVLRFGYTGSFHRA
ncbi:MAG: hypothetical protein WA397_10300, partial [Roseiarcus sp.]